VRCARVIEGSICPHCLEVAETNGRQLRATLEGILVGRGGMAGALSAHEQLKSRVARAMAEFSIPSVLPQLPDWAAALADPNVLRFLEGVTVRKVVVVPGRLVNIVAN
jgi:leucyl-tRNA synthetase